MILGCAGLVALLAAAWILASSFHAAANWPQLRHVLASPDSHVAELLPTDHEWVLPVAAVVSVLVALLGLYLALSQIPRKARTAALRLTSEDGSLLATIDPGVIESALAERAKELTGVSSCSVWVAGSSRSVWIQATVSVAKDAQLAWVVESVRRRLADDAAIALGHAPSQVDVLVRPDRSSTSDTVTNVASASPVSLGQENHPVRSRIALSSRGVIA